MQCGHAGPGPGGQQRGHGIGRGICYVGARTRGRDRRLNPESCVGAGPGRDQADYRASAERRRPADVGDRAKAGAKSGCSEYGR